MAQSASMVNNLKQRRDSILSHKREILAIIVECVSVNDVRCRFIAPFGRIPGRLKEMGTLVRGLSESQSLISESESLPGLLPFQIPQESALRYFDWGLDELPDTMPIVSIPAPGVLFLVFGASSDESTVHLGLHFWKHKLAAAPTIVQYLASFDASVQPTHVPAIDVFISYSVKDSSLAKELESKLAKLGIKTFLAEKSLEIGLRWQGQIQQAVRDSRMLVVLLTPNSVKSSWVMLEAGAAWGLEIPLVPVLAYVKPEELPAPISDYQCRNFVTGQEKDSLVAEIESKLVQSDGPVSR